MKLQKSFAGIVTVLFLLFIVPSVFAHGDEPRLEISLERINPGGVIDVRGVDFEFEETITLDLVGPDVIIPMGAYVADAEGVFVQVIMLPVDLKEGKYQFRATTDDHIIMSPMFEVWGTAIVNEGEDEGRDEDDGLYAPMPTFAPGESVTPLAVVQGQKTPTSPANAFPWMIVLVAMSAAVLLFLALYFTRKRGS